MATYFIPVDFTNNTIAELAKYFSKKKALSKERAVELTGVDWASMGFSNSTPRQIIKKYPFIKETDGKYWFDQEELEKYQIRQKKILNWVIALAILLAATLIALPFLLS
jgi:Icc-related predicted phosphoesterase